MAPSKRQKLSKAAKKAARVKEAVEERRMVEQLELRIRAQALPLGAGPDYLDRSPDEFYPAATRFDQLPLSNRTLKAISEAGFETLTGIQRASIPHLLVGRNVVGTAKTGSGKTLAFLIPLVERLYREDWGPESGLGAIVVSPTRELAMQTFDALKMVCKYHNLQGGLLIGKGLDLTEERSNVSRYAIVVATPGRLLQHFDESPELKTDSLQMIVFDECDRLLDMGFEKAIDAILGHLPPIVSGESHELQCLMFSATNNRVLVSQRIRDVQFVDVDPHRHSKSATPNSLQHFMMEVTLDMKMTLLWSFIKQHLFAKMMIFVASCKQARYLEEVLRRLSVTPGWIGAIHGRLPQLKRMGKYYEFRKLKNGILICTDVAARGLDFPAVDWVIQMDAPDDPDTYIHRVGRTARLGGQGSALLMLMPSEKALVNKLGQRGIVLETVEPKAAKMVDPSGDIQSLISSDQELKYAAQKAFITYMRSVYLAIDKEVFSITELPYKQYAKSLGLISVPKIKFGKSKQTDKNVPYALRAVVSKRKLDTLDGDADGTGHAAGQGGAKEAEEAEEDHYLLNASKPRVPQSRIDKLLSRGQHRPSLRDVEDDEADNASDDGDLFVLKREDHELGDGEEPDVTGGARKKRFIVDPEVDSANWKVAAEIHSQAVRERIEEQDPQDRMTAKERRKLRRMQEKKERRERLKMRKLAKKPQGLESDVDGGDLDGDHVRGSEEEEAEAGLEELPQGGSIVAVIPDSVAEREKLALKMLQDDF